MPVGRRMLTTWAPNVVPDVAMLIRCPAVPSKSSIPIFVLEIETVWATPNEVLPV